MTKSIPLTKGKFALVDDEDYEYLNQWKWHFGSNGYALRTVWLKSRVYMHRDIIGTPNGMFTDHINGNKLDNRRANLRICSKSENAVNSKLFSTNKTNIRGVSLFKGKRMKAEKWRATITVNQKQIHLGLFDTKEKAAEAYKDAAQKHFGAFINDNNK